jgi:hypothetical protein
MLFQTAMMFLEFLAEEFRKTLTGRTVQRPGHKCIDGRQMIF